MHDSGRSNDLTKTARSVPPTLKERNAVQRSVERLLDELAPEKALRRGEAPRMHVEQHRTPTGCVLQAPNSAVSVSWFADTSQDLTHGELQVVLWRGVVTRRGATRPAKGAEVASELVLHPVERADDSLAWRTSDGRELDSEALAAHCLELLETLQD